MASAAIYQGSFDVRLSEDSLTIGSECQEDWSGSKWGTCINGQQTFICFDKNQCGATNLQPANCGEVRSCGNNENSNNGGSSSGSSKGSSGKSSSSSSIIQSNSNNQQPSEECIESWQCGDWSNSENECGTRTCFDKNNCKTKL
ncbi:MAG: hypothetical protein IH843_06850, partial [Thaumarchaeota archaeon]|nr:hypothetical protein [Nitrososphaerota archaeon]